MKAQAQLEMQMKKDQDAMKVEIAKLQEQARQANQKIQTELFKRST